MRRSSDRYNVFMNDNIRIPIVSGMFYPNEPEQLRGILCELLGAAEDSQTPPIHASRGLIAPHAGYIYSGGIAAKGFLEVAQAGRPDVVVILGASHTRVGPWFALSPHLEWETPLGRSPVDPDVMARLLEEGFACEAASFEREHSIEVLLPFIQYLWGTRMPIVPICVSPAPLSRIQDAAKGLIKALGVRKGLVIASSDFTHFEPDSEARITDIAALDRILDLDVEGFRELCQKNRLTICGATAIEVLMSVAANASWTATQTLGYATSGDVTGDLSSVVGYASVLMTKENYG
jgi:MEMO1 family protein